MRTRSAAADYRTLVRVDVTAAHAVQAGGFLCADGFGSTTIMYKRVEEPPPSAMFRITTKLTYVQQKMYNSILSEIGVHEVRKSVQLLNGVSEDGRPRTSLALLCRAGPACRRRRRRCCSRGRGHVRLQ